MDLELKNKVAIVAASRSGLGKAVALRLLDEGSKVVVCGRLLASLKDAYSDHKFNKNLCLVEADITVRQDVDKLVAKAVDHFGGIDILITNCGGPPLLTFSDANEDIWKGTFNSILMSAINLISSSLEYLKKSQTPSILTITSMAAKVAMSGFILSNVFRPAILGLTKSLSQEFGQYNIRVNSILPGYIFTDRLSEAISGRATLQNISKEKIIDEIEKTLPMGKIGTPEEFASVATFMVSPRSSYLNGVMLAVEGGVLKNIF